MYIADRRTQIEWLEREECLRLVATQPVGRLAVTVGEVPAVFPVNFVLDGEAVVFRSVPGTKWRAGQRHPVCFEVDWFDADRREGWSVAVTGRLEEVTPADPVAFARVTGLEVEPWAGGMKDRWMRVVPERITGRRVRAS